MKDQWILVGSAIAWTTFIAYGVATSTLDRDVPGQKYFTVFAQLSSIRGGISKPSMRSSSDPVDETPTGSIRGEKPVEIKDQNTGHQNIANTYYLISVIGSRAIVSHNGVIFPISIGERLANGATIQKFERLEDGWRIVTDRGIIRNLPNSVR